MGCSENSLTTRFQALLGALPQVKSGISHSRSVFGHAENYTGRIANQAVGGEVVVSSLVYELPHRRPVRVRAVARSSRKPLSLPRPGDDEAGVGAVDAYAPQRTLARCSLAFSLLVPSEEDAVALR